MTNPSEVMKRYLDRLHQSARRSGLLHAFPTRTIKRLDITRLDEIQTGKTIELLQKLIANDDARIEIDLDLQHPDPVQQKIHAELYHILRNGLARMSEAFCRETGVRSLWLAYPLFHIAVDRDNSSHPTHILAPIFLWPLKIEVPLTHQGRIIISRHKDDGAPKYNKSLDLWVAENLAFNPNDPRPEELDKTSLERLEKIVADLYSGLRSPPQVRLTEPVNRIPLRRALDQYNMPRVLNAGIIGLIQWEHQALIRDFEALQCPDHWTDLVSDYLKGNSHDHRPVTDIPHEGDKFLVTHSDPSQEQAIWAARHAPGIVVQGPPGTGKSQTIVNMVADALAHGERVLVVCQKRAAIDVVAERLKAHSLNNLFCVVHDSESDRMSTVKAIREQLGALRKHETPPQFAEKRLGLAREITRLEQSLDDYMRTRCDRLLRGISYKDLLIEIARLVRDYPGLQPIDDIGRVFAERNHNELLSIENQIQSAGELWDAANPLSNVWRHRKQNISIDPLFKQSVAEAVGAIRQAERNHAEFIAQHGKGTVIDYPPQEFCRMAHAWREAVVAAIEPERFPYCVAWTKSFHCGTDAQYQSLTTDLMRARELATNIRKLPIDQDRAQLLGDAYAHTMRLQLETTRELLTRQPRWWRWFSAQYRQARTKIRPLIPSSLPVTVDELRKLEQLLTGLLDRYELQGILSNLPHQSNATNDDEMVMAVESHGWASQFAKSFHASAGVDTWFADVCLHMEMFDPDALRNDLNNLDIAIQRAAQVQAVEDAVTAFQPWLKHEYLDGIRQLVRHGKSIDDEINKIEEGLRRLQSLQALDIGRLQRDEPARSVLALLEQHQTHKETDLGTARRWWALAQLSAYLNWQRNLEQRHPILVQTSTQQFEQQRQQLADLLATKRKLEPVVIQEIWRTKQAARTKAHLEPLLKLSGANSKRLREIIDLGREVGLFDFRPCWLTNPNTASQIFPLAAGFFDLVIFDEASQCPIEQAIPPIYRAKRVVIAGDRKQLPPTSFFISNFSFGENENNENDETVAVDTEDSVQARIEQEQLAQAKHASDLLEASRTLLRNTMLRVHYRSEHPSLIQFSNHAFYAGQLEIPPSIIDASDGERHLVLVEANGVYDDKTNPIEAKRVVQLLREIWESDKHDMPTMGVVTFNQDQRDLIEDMLQEEAACDSWFRAQYEAHCNRTDGEQDVGLFVKNLESVQGDERDVMIFSTTFGRDPEGKFWRNFGPINLLGGERRLNVAITRAKKRNYLVTSMPLSEISDQLAGGSVEMGFTPTGRDYLHAYMQYVRDVSSGDVEAQARSLQLALQLSQSHIDGPDGRPEESPFEEEVREAISKLGYKSDPQVGDGGFRIDIAVRHPTADRGYVLGVECDGKTYHSTWCARARDVWRQQILESRGWKIHRIWSSNWWVDREGEIEKLRIRLQSLLPPL